MNKLGQMLIGIGFFAFLISASGIDSGSKANLIVCIVSLGTCALGTWIDGNYVTYDDEDVPGKKRHHR